MLTFFTILGRSSYPWLISIQVLSLASSFLVFLKYGVFLMLFFCFFSLSFTIIYWTSTIVLEGMMGMHAFLIMDCLKFTFILFIFSEVMFFFSIFWAFFDSALSPSMELGEEWSPLGISPVNPFGIPLFNTVVLLSSGATLTWSHSCVLSKKSPLISLGLTLFLALLFESAQFIEFKEATFSMSDGVYGSIFYISTGFHGLHVIFGHIFLIYNFFRIFFLQISRTHHLGFEFAIVYWHFVDVVWLFLYTFIYWWSF